MSGGRTRTPWALESRRSEGTPPCCWLAARKRQAMLARRLSWPAATPSRARIAPGADPGVFSVGGLLAPHTALVATRPFRFVPTTAALEQPLIGAGRCSPARMNLSTCATGVAALSLTGIFAGEVRPVPPAPWRRLRCGSAQSPERSPFFPGRVGLWRHQSCPCAGWVRRPASGPCSVAGDSPRQVYWSRLSGPLLVSIRPARW